MPTTQEEFYRLLVGREYTVSTLVQISERTRVTIMKWLKQRNIEAIPGSWPPKYTLEGLTEIKPKGKPKKKPKSVPNTEIARYLEHLLTKETMVYDLVSEFRNIKSPEDAQMLIKGLEDALTTARYYKTVLEEGGLI